jgi:hypothetical protein
MRTTNRLFLQLTDPDYGENEGSRHESGARHAPLADGVDHEELEVREVGAEEDADEGDEQAEQHPALAPEKGCQKQSRVTAHPASVATGIPQISAYRLDWTTSQPPLPARQMGDTPRRWTHVR